MKYILSAILFSVIAFNACAQIKDDNSITNAEFRQILKNNPNSVVLDVRTPQELNGPLGKIEGVMNIPIQQLQNRIGELAEYKDEEIIIICRTQNRSSAAVDILLKHGFRAKCVLGGMSEFSRNNTN